MKTGKRILSIFLVALLLLTAAPLAGFVGLEIAPKAQALVESGQCGDNVTWSFNSSTGALTISGTGSMQNYSYNGSPFDNSREIKSVTINSGVTSIGDYAFNWCISLTSVTIPDGVTSIGSYAFRYCTALTSVTIPDSVTSIGRYAFYYCTSLTSVTIGNSVTSIGDCAFESCTSLTSVTIPDSVTRIGSSAFHGCRSLTSVTIPNSVTSIGSYAFSYCRSLTVFSVDENNRCYASDANGCLYNKNKTKLIQYPIGNKRTSFTIPDSVTSIGNRAFYYCTSLTSVTIPDSVTSIDDFAFYYCTSLTSVTIPDSVTSIGSSAFSGCTALKDVCYTGSQEQWQNISIGSYNEPLTNATIHFNSTGSSINTGEIHATTFNPQSTTGVYQFSGILEDYVTTVVLNGSDIYIENVTIDGKKYNIKKDVLSTDKAEQLKGKSVICNYDKNTEEIIAISKCREFSDLDQTDISNINKENRISVIIANEYKWLNGKVYVAGGTKEAGAIPFKIEIGNSLPSNYFDLSDSCKKNSAFDITISDVKLTGLENCGQIFLNDNSFPKKVKLGESIYLEGSIYFPSDFWLGYEDSEKTITAEYEIQMNIGKDKKAFQTVVKNRDSKLVTQNESDLLTDAVNKLKKTSNNAISLAGLAELGFSRAQIQYLEKAVLVELSLYTMPAESLEEYVSKKVIEKIFSVKNLLGVQDGKMTIVVPYQNGTKQVDIVCDIQGYTLSGRSFGNFTNLTYHAYDVKKGKREKVAFKDGVAGLSVSANVEAFAEAATDLALGEIKSASKKVLNGYEEVERIIFGDTALKILSAAGYNSNFDFGWDLYVNQCKAIGLACPVDVYVYDKNDTLCGAIVNNEVTLDTSDDVDLEVLNDEKRITLWEDGYYVKTLANCEGNLNITVKEMGYINGAIRTMTFENLPLRVGTLYRQDYGTDYYDDQSVFAVEELNGDRIEATSDTLNLITESIYESHTHTYISAVTTPATCTEPGVMTFTCVDGDDTYTEPIPATGNHLDDNNDGKCDTCGEKMTGGKHCKYCGKIHGGAFGWLVKFFHSIFAIFKR